jgi:Hsp20/alpha crystallin family
VTFEPEARMLSIAGKRATERSETNEAGRFSRLERRFGAFQRRFKLPQNVDAGAISAKVGIINEPWLDARVMQAPNPSLHGCLLHMQLCLPLQLNPPLPQRLLQHAAARFNRMIAAVVCARALLTMFLCWSLQVNNGELEVRIPKTAAAPKQQEIKVE